MLEPRNAMHCRGLAPSRTLAVLSIPFLLVGVLNREAGAEDAVVTLWLDSDSYISYSDSEKAKIAEGSRIRFHLGRSAGDGSIPIAVEPTDVSIAPIPIAEGASIEYSLAETATGTLREGSAGAEIELVATLVATLRGRPEVPPTRYELRFTTGRAQAESSDRSDSVAVDGAPATVLGAVQLVGAATNRPDAYPGPGEAVYAVLSGRFDSLPTSATKD